MNLLRSIILTSLVTAILMTSSFTYRELAPLRETSTLGQIDSAITDSKNEVAADLAERKVTILFFGDLMLDRRVRKLIGDNRSCAYPFSLIDPLIDGADIKVANLEGPITGNASESILTNGLKFTQPIECLSDLGSRFQVVSLANNHIQDFGHAGFLESKKNLQMAGIGYFGDYNNSSESYHIREVNGIKIAFVGWNEFSWTGTSRVILDIEKVRQKSDFVVVMPHWGEEYELTPKARQKKAAEEFVKAGADLIVGSHPHVIQDIGEINGRPVFYSLGNFVFDQYFRKEVTEGLAILATLKRDGSGIGASYKLIPIKITNSSQTHVMSDKEAATIFEKLAESSDVTDITRAEIVSGEINRD